MFTWNFLLLLVGLSCISYSLQESQLKVVVYYEGLCGCSRNFIVEQLYPAYQKCGDSILVDLVPFGNAIGVKTDDGWEWDCQHGPLECYINKVEACLISFKPPQSQLLSSVNCISKGINKQQTSDEIKAIAKQESQLSVVLYYEGLCPYCHEFILEQLYPGYQKLGDSIHVDLVPFGKASATKSDDGWQWECQHGPLECYLNKVDACLISLKPTQSQLLSFVNCHTQSTSRDITFNETENIVKQCAEDNKLSWDDINECVATGRADTLLLANQDRQSKLDPPVQYVPNIRFNDVYNENLEDLAREDFVWTVCSLLNGTKPRACDG